VENARFPKVSITMMIRKIAAIAAWLWLSAGAALAQTSPNLTFGQVLTPAQWNQLFINKQDTIGFTPLNVAGGVMSGRLVTASPSSTTAGFNLTPGSTPASPVNGDFWLTSTGVFAQVNGATVGPFTSAATPCTNCALTTNPLSQFASTTSAQLAGVISNETGTGLLVFNNGAALTSPILTTPTLGVATGTSLALGGATLGGNVLAVNGGMLSGSISAVGVITAQTSNAAALTVGANGATNPAFSVNTATALQVSGVGVRGDVTGGTPAIAAIDSGANTNLSIDSKGGGQLTLNGTATGPIVLSRATTISAALTYGGVTLSNSVIGTGSMVLSANPTITGSFTATGLVTYADMATAAIASCSQYAAATASTLTASANVFCGETATTFGATTTFDFSTFINTAVTLTGNITTMSVANVKAGQAGSIAFIQDATGSRTTVWNSILKFSGGTTPTLSTAANAIDVLFYSCRSATVCPASLVLNMK
jgi:hypothetical protein